MTLNTLLQLLSSQGYKITPRRKSILTCLIANQKNLITVEELCSKSKKICPNINISTIYRNLQLFEELQVVDKIIVDDGIAKYKLIQNHKHHHHLICTSCGKTDVIDFCPIKNLEPIIKNKDFQLMEHKLELYGYCKNCRNNS